MTDDTQKAATLWLLEVVLGHERVDAGTTRDRIWLPHDLRARGEQILARARHEQDRPEDRG